LTSSSLSGLAGESDGFSDVFGKICPLEKNELNSESYLSGKSCFKDVENI
jgi:hypothetical protein